MPRNPIVALPNDLFINLQGLRYLSFHKNKLKFIGHDILMPLKNLESANFCENTTIDKAFNGGTEELAALNNEIALKCIAPTQTKMGAVSMHNKTFELEKRIQLLEQKVSKLEKEKEMQAAKFSQIAGLHQMIEVLQSRVGEIESSLM